MNSINTVPYADQMLQAKIKFQTDIQTDRTDLKQYAPSFELGHKHIQCLSHIQQTKMTILLE